MFVILCILNILNGIIFLIWFLIIQKIKKLTEDNNKSPVFYALK